MATTNFNLRLEQDLRDKAFPVFERYGLSASQAFKLFLTKCRELYRKSGERSRGDFLIRKPESIGG